MNELITIINDNRTWLMPCVLAGVLAWLGFELWRGFCKDERTEKPPISEAIDKEREARP